VSEDCIAMSDDGSWAAYPKTMKRGQVFSHIAQASELHGLDFWTLTHHYTVRAGFVTEYPHADRGWWTECAAEDVWATPCWILRRK
jgi:hypothetical protein